MTRKDYILIAAAIKAAGRGDGYEADDVGRLVTLNIARELAHKLGDDNARFDRTRFLKACGVQS